MLSAMYYHGHGVERDKKEIHHLEVAAIGGNPEARHSLGWEELDCGRKERAVKHFIIAANLGFDPSIKMLKKFYFEGLVTKEDLAAALRAYQATVDATKSAQREAAERARKNQG
jgi:TPR repeat protein